MAAIKLNYIFFLLGLCLGITFNLIQLPFLADDCFIDSSQKLNFLKELKESDNLEDYEPKIIVDMTFDEDALKLKAKPQKEIFRPRFYSSELEIKENLFVAISINNEALNSFGIALNKTLNHHINKLIFFLDSPLLEKVNINIPLVNFVEADSLPHVLKILMYICDNFLGKYNYYLIAPHDSYISGIKLMNLVTQLGVSQDIYMGVPAESSHCLFGAGVLLSNSVLSKIMNNLDWCKKNSDFSHPSQGIGKCVIHSANITCLNSMHGVRYESYIMPHSIMLQSDMPFIRNNSIGKNIITFRNIVTSKDIYALHVYSLQDAVKETVLSIKSSKKEICNLPSHFINVTWPVGSVEPSKSDNRYDVIVWQYFNMTHLFFPNELETIVPLRGSDLLDILNVLNLTIAHALAKYEKLKFLHFDYGHRRLDPVRGTDYLMSLEFYDSARKQNVSKMFQAARMLTMTELIRTPYVNENSPVTILVPLYGNEVKAGVTFFNRFVEKLLDPDIFVCFAFIKSESDEQNNFQELESVILEHAKQNEDIVRGGWINIVTDGKALSTFAVVDLVVEKFPKETLLVVTSCLAHFSTPFISRVRLNTVLDWQVFSPVPFTKFHPVVVDNEVLYNSDDVVMRLGHFDSYDYGHISFYLQNYLAERQRVQNIIPIIGSQEDLKHKDRPEEYDFGLYELFLKGSGLRVLRAAEPDLRLEYSEVTCDSRTVKSEPLKENCMKQRENSLGMRAQLARLIIKHKERMAENDL